MFLDGWDERKVVDTVESALTNTEIPKREKIRINQQGTTEVNNTTLPPNLKGRANGIRVEGIISGGVLQTVYPLVG
jgi:hypothetical protein